MDLQKEQKIKSKLGLILKILLIALAVFKLSDFVWSHIESSMNSELKNENNVVIDSTANQGDNDKEVSSIKNATLNEESKPLANSASVYIFSVDGLDAEASRHISKVFFDDYKLMGMPSGFQKEDLLLGNLNSAANTELVCVGTVNYSCWKNSRNDTTCNVNINFDTYNKNTGEKVKHLSKSIYKNGVGRGNDKNGAKQMALQKVQS